MREKLMKQFDNSYSPYSNFRVSALVKMKDGTEFLGSNIENASYGATICAERVAIASALANGYKKGDFESLFVMCEHDKVGMPCFLCRQVIEEFFEKEDPITVMNPKGESIVLKVEELCPYPFNEDNLK